MKLPKHIELQVEEDAKKYSQQRHEDLEGKKHIRIKTISYYSYRSGAIIYAEKWLQVSKLAEKYEKALKDIAEGKVLPQLIAQQALKDIL